VVGADGTIYVVSGASEDPASDWRLHALDPDCSPVWSFRLPGWPGRTMPAIGADGTVYVHTNGTQNIAGPPHLVAVNPDGTEAWDLLYHGDVAALSSSTPSAPVVATDGSIWFGSPDTWLYAVEPDGDIACAAQSPTVSSIDTSPAIAADGTVYVLDVTNELMAVDATCGLEWSLGLQPASSTMDSTVAIDPGETVYVSANEDLVAVGAAGAELWRVDFGEPVSTPAIAADGSVYVESEGLAKVSPDGDVRWEGRSCLSWTASSGGVDDPPVIGADGTVYHQQNSAENVVCAFRPDGTRAWSLVREFGTAGGRLAITATARC
jgi:outer membrane protein assembly factor BamB